MRSAIAKLLTARNRDRRRGREYCGARHSSDRARKPDTDTSKRAALFEGEALRVRRFTEKPDADDGCRVRGCGKLFLEQRNVFVECANVGQCAAGASTQDRGAAGENCGHIWHGKICRDISQAVSEVRKHQRGLCGARAAFGKGREAKQYFLPSGGFRMERSRLVDGAA